VSINSEVGTRTLGQHCQADANLRERQPQQVLRRLQGRAIVGVAWASAIVTGD
jgi:hypothetical protein